MSTEISGNPLLERCARRIAKLVEMGLTGQDTTLCWLKRWIQPLQHRDRLMHEYTGIKDPMRITQGELVSKALDDRLQKIIDVKKDVKTKVREYKYSLNMYENGKCPDVSFDNNKVLVALSALPSGIISTCLFADQLSARRGTWISHTFGSERRTKAQGGSSRGEQDQKAPQGTQKIQHRRF